jgi:obg-like ATPase 1
MAYLMNSSDFENKFVCGEIMTYADLHEYGSESATKAVSSKHPGRRDHLGVSNFVAGWEDSATRSTVRK